MSFLESDDFLVDKIRISHLIQQWSIWRDYGQWAALRSAFTPDATVRLTVFVGPAAKYIENAEYLDKNKNLKHVSNHIVGGSAIEVVGEKALAQTHLTLTVRTKYSGIEVDLTGIGRFYDRLVKKDNIWKIFHREVLFDKDFIAQVNKDDSLSFDLDELAGYPAHYRYNCLVVKSFGLNPDLTSPAPHSKELSELYVDNVHWLNS